jgi:hypothetical protein
MELLAAIRLRLSGEFRARVAVSVSLDVPEDTTRLLKAAEPKERFAEVDPLSVSGLPEMDTGLPATVTIEPLSVNCTTGAGERAKPTVPFDGGWVVKTSA